MISNEYKERQRKFLKTINDNGIVIVFAAKDPKDHQKAVCKFRQNSDFYYLTGFEESDAIAVFIRGRKSWEYILFSQEKKPEIEVWTGKKIGQIQAREEYGADQAFPLEKATAMIPELIKSHQQIYFNTNDHEDYELILSWVRSLQGQERQGFNPPLELIDIGKELHEMRMRKSPEEILLIRKACEISAAAHLRAMKACKPGIREYELEAELVYDFLRQGGSAPAFEPIIAGGVNACILHYTKNDMLLKDGDLVLIDVGVEYKHYAGDITRTLPINGKFSLAQRAVYQAVLDTQLAVIKAIKPGITWFELHQLSERLITEKLLTLGLLQGKLEDLVVAKAFKPFYMHFIGHWLGLDVHDVGFYKIKEDQWRKVEPGMVFTVEPGIYIDPEISGIDKKWAGIGVRIEDDILVTENGCEVLTAGVPKSIEAIESLMQN
jgi:Xaa-Pro aminopeptidase